MTTALRQAAAGRYADPAAVARKAIAAIDRYLPAPAASTEPTEVRRDLPRGGVMIAMQSSGFWFTIWPFIVGILLVCLTATVARRVRRNKKRPVI